MNKEMTNHFINWARFELIITCCTLGYLGYLVEQIARYGGFKAVLNSYLIAIVLVMFVRLALLWKAGAMDKKGWNEWVNLKN